MLIITVTTQSALAVDEALDIEKVAIKSLENSQIIKSYQKNIDVVERQYDKVKGQLEQAKWALLYYNSFEIVESLILTPKQFENVLHQLYNGQRVINNATRLAAYNSYIELLKCDYAVKVQYQLMNSLYEDYKKIRTMCEKGIATESEVKLAEIAFERTRHAYLSEKSKLESAYLAINQMMGEDINKKYSTLIDSNIAPNKKIGTLEEYISRALNNRVEISNALGDLELKKEMYIYGLTKIPADFDFYKQQQEYEIAEAENKLELAKINVQENIIELYAGLESLMKIMEAKSNQAEQAKLEYEAAKIKYELSQITLVELNNKKVAMNQADIELKKAELDVWFMQMTMELACNEGFQFNQIQ